MVLNPSRIAEAIWYSDSLAAVFLLPFSWLFRLLTALRRFCYRRGWLSAVKVPVPVVVVGNISAGGTGKTPVVDWLARLLLAAGYRPGIVSRGYGGKHRQACVPVQADSDPAVVGDEPVLLARRTACPVCVGADRVAAARELVRQGVNIIIADDGLQHYRLQRDLEIAVIDGARGVGNGYLIPAGPLREPKSRLQDVDFVFLNGGSDTFAGSRFDLRAGPAMTLDDTAQRGLDEFAGQSVWAVAGIGNPERFYKLLAGHGIDAQPVAVPDHGYIDLVILRQTSNRPVLMTEKDAIKYLHCGIDSLWYIPVSAEFDAVTGDRLLAAIADLEEQ